MLVAISIPAGRNSCTRQQLTGHALSEHPCFFLYLFQHRLFHDNRITYQFNLRFIHESSQLLGGSVCPGETPEITEKAVFQVPVLQGGKETLYFRVEFVIVGG